MGLPTSFRNLVAVATTTSTGAVVTVFTHSSSLKNPDGSSGNGGVLDRLLVYNADSTGHTINLYKALPGTCAASSNLIDSIYLPTGSAPYIFEGPLFGSSGDFYAFRLLEAAASSGGVIVTGHYHEMA